MAYRDKRVLAVVPARSGSKGIPHKNLLPLRGVSLIGWAGRALADASFVDTRIISTDSQAYADEGRRYGLEVPFLRPAALASDSAGALEMLQHALAASEAAYECRFDIMLVVEPTSPLRLAADLERATRLLVDSGADSVVTVSHIDAKHHPLKVFRVDDGWLRYFDPRGADVQRRQQLSPLYTRNGVCYAISRASLAEQGRIISDRTLALVIDRSVVNIDTMLDVALAEVLLERAGCDVPSPVTGEDAT